MGENQVGGGVTMLQRDCAKAPWQQEAGTARRPDPLGRASSHCREAGELQVRAWVTGRGGSSGLCCICEVRANGCAACLDVGHGRQEAGPSRMSDLSS